MKKQLFEYRRILEKDWLWLSSDKKSWSYLTLPGHLSFPLELGKMIKNPNVVIQAGGHCGLYPYQYSSIFNTVYTFEPESKNYHCLKENLKECNNVKLYNLGLGNKHETKGLKIDRRNTGKHMITDSCDQTIEIITIDSLNLDNVDLIHLDLEGFELFALQGAVKTIEKNKPLIVLETNDLCLEFGYSIEDLNAWLKSIGYQQFQTWDDDTAYMPF